MRISQEINFRSFQHAIVFAAVSHFQVYLNLFFFLPMQKDGKLCDRNNFQPKTMRLDALASTQALLLSSVNSTFQTS